MNVYYVFNSDSFRNANFIPVDYSITKSNQFNTKFETLMLIWIRYFTCILRKKEMEDKQYYHDDNSAKKPEVVIENMIRTRNGNFKGGPLPLSLFNIRLKS